jgi:hypothetical protein
MAQEDDDTLIATATLGLSATAAAAVQFTLERPGWNDTAGTQYRSGTRDRGKAEYPDNPAEMRLAPSPRTWRGPRSTMSSRSAKPIADGIDGSRLRPWLAARWRLF